MAETGKKIGKGNPPKSTQFKKGQKPPATPEQKKAGRERKKQAQKIMDMVLEYQEMTKADLETMQTDPNITVLQSLLIRYVLLGTRDSRMLIDFIDRHISRAPQQMEIGGPDGGPVQQVISYSIPDNQRG